MANVSVVGVVTIVYVDRSLKCVWLHLLDGVTHTLLMVILPGKRAKEDTHKRRATNQQHGNTRVGGGVRVRVCV